MAYRRSTNNDFNLYLEKRMRDGERKRKPAEPAVTDTCSRVCKERSIWTRLVATIRQIYRKGDNHAS